ncbi:MAG: glycosyltransferase family 4 protein [Candidatus Pacebacteria bacterium]|nr:glycosyltransferase family 4 protein [Candidatus Paceibacterota bacterium]
MKKIVIATPLYSPEIGGPATYSKELVDGLPAYGIEISLVKFSDVRHLPKLLRHFVYYRRVLAALKNADAVLALDPVSVGLPAMRAARKLNKKFLVKIVGDYAWEQGVQRFGVTQDLDEFVVSSQPSFAVRTLQNIQKKVALAADRIIVPSPYLKEVVQKWGIPEEKILVINNGIRIPESLPVYTKKPGEFLIVSAGRRVPWKGFEAIERVAEKNVGSNWRAKIISGQAREEVLGWMKAADVFVLNSRYEGFPHALAEAMTLGIPVVATDTKAHRYLVGESGILVPPGDDTALEQELMNIAKNSDAARERARGGQERMKQFAPARMLDATAEFLKSL